MKKILMTIGVILVVAVVGILGVASLQPDTYHVERSASFAAAPVDVYPFVNDYTKWATWNPWKDIDPKMKTANSSNPVGVGAWTTWEGNSDAGKGKMTITESVPDQKVVHDLHFMEPFEDTAKVTFTMTASGEQTKFTWAMDGSQNLMGKVMCLFSSMDSMVGGDFERGLANLKPLAEAGAADRKKAEQQAAEQAAAAAAAALQAAAVAPVAPAP